MGRPKSTRTPTDAGGCSQDSPHANDPRYKCFELPNGKHRYERYPPPARRQDPDSKKYGVIKPDNPYMVFYKQHYKRILGQFNRKKREDIWEPYPDKPASNRDVAKAAGAVWRTMTPEQKQPYIDESKRRVQLYRENVEAFKLNTGKDSIYITDGQKS